MLRHHYYIEVDNMIIIKNIHLNLNLSLTLLMGKHEALYLIIFLRILNCLNLYDM